jgi:RNA-directed DNA polymerase
MNTKNNWNDLNWRKIYASVKILQSELVVAYKNKDWVKVHFIQEKLAMSFDARCIAVRKVTVNDGKKTPGFDNIVWNNPIKKFQAIKELREILVGKSGSYQSGPTRRVWIPKSTPGELRPIGIPNMIDRALQALIFLCLDPIVEEMSDTYSYGFRSFRSPSDAIQRIRTILDKRNSPKWLWDVDISKCFDSISHEFLKKNLKVLLYAKGNEYTSKWLKASIIDKGVITIPVIGIPQGNILSPLLCNITLNGLENAIREGLPSPTSKEGRKLKGIWCIRYADDFIVTSPDQNRIILEIIPKVKQFLSERGLVISEKKTRIVNLEKEGFDFLGWRICLFDRNLKKNNSSYNKKVLVIKPTKKALKHVKLKIKAKFVPNKPIRGLIKDLNPILRGWSNYYRSSFHSQKTFQSIGHYVYQSWWRWALKKHSTKSKTWIYNQYIFKSAKRSWNIGYSKSILLFDITQAKQIKVNCLKNNVNPYMDEEYYVSRPLIVNAEKFRKAIYEKYNFRCPVCNQALFGEEDIHLHHIIPRKDDGQYSLTNIAPLHQICHENITYTKNLRNIFPRKT